MSVAGATGYLYPLQSGDAVGIGCDGSYLSYERVSATVGKLACTGTSDTTTPDAGPPSTPDTSPPNIDGQPPAAATGGAIWNRVFDDEFNDTSIDTSQWNVQDNSTFGSSNNELECYMASNANEGGGSLDLVAAAGGAGCPGYWVSSGMVTQARPGRSAALLLHARLHRGPHQGRTLRSGGLARVLARRRAGISLVAGLRRDGRRRDVRSEPHHRGTQLPRQPPARRATSSPTSDRSPVGTRTR